MKKILLRATCLLLSLTILCAFASCGEKVVVEISDDPILSASHTESNDGEEISPPAEPSSEGETSPPEEEQREDPAEKEEPKEETTESVAAPIYREPENDLTAYLAACASANVNVRRGPSASYALLATLRKGDSLPYLWREGDWIAVWTGERVGYLASAYAFVTETNRALERSIRAGLDKLGSPYEWGAPRILNEWGRVSPYFTGKTFDCSSFVQYCYYIGCGIKLGNYTGNQADHTVGEKITRYADLRRGDFYFTGSSTISHVVIYLGGGLLLQTYSANGGPVSVTTEDRWRGKFLSGRRPDLTVVEQFR